MLLFLYTKIISIYTKNYIFIIYKFISKFLIIKYIKNLIIFIFMNLNNKKIIVNLYLIKNKNVYNIFIF